MKMLLKCLRISVIRRLPFWFILCQCMHIAHIPDTAKKEAILKHLATPENRLDAIVQSGKNMSMRNVAEKLESRMGIPILGTNAATFWYCGKTDSKIL